MLAIHSLASDFSHAQFVGLWEENSNFYRTSAPGAKVSFRISGGKLALEMAGNSYWQIILNGKHVKKILVTERAFYTITDSLARGNYLVEIVHCSESLPGESFVYGVQLSKSEEFLPIVKSSRRIEFIGDSYTVGYGVEALGPEEGTVEETTNTTKSYAYLIAEKLRADYRISAFSGRGLVRNYAGIEPKWPIPELIKYTVPGMAASDKGGALRDFSAWVPSVMVIFVGINDFQGEGGHPSQAEFVKAYREMLSKFRKNYPGVKFLLVATKVWPEDLLIPAVQQVFEEENKAGFKDIAMKVVYSENTALHGHPNERSQAEMARILLPEVARLGGFLSR